MHSVSEVVIVMEDGIHGGCLSIHWREEGGVWVDGEVVWVGGWRGGGGWVE